MNIRFLDFKMDNAWERFILKICGIDYYGEYRCNKNILTREILEAYLDEIVDRIILFEDYVDNDILRPRNPKYDGWWVISEDDIYIGYQILGILILQTGPFLPKLVEDSILYSTTWEHDKQRMWVKSAEDIRKKNLAQFRDAIQHHQAGVAIEINF